MIINTLKGSGFACNTYVLISGKEAAVIDPSVDVSVIFDVVKPAEIKYILLTHGHFDHFLTLDDLKKQTDAIVCIHKADAELLANSDINASKLLLNYPITSAPADKLLDDGEILHLGSDDIKVISLPGHTEGSVCYKFGESLICGDTLFASSYGRYDLPGGDPFKLSASLEILSDRKDDPMIYPGHGPSCSLSSADYIIYLRKISK